MILGRQQKGRAAIRHYANLREPSFNLCSKLYPAHVLRDQLAVATLGMWGEILVGSKDNKSHEETQVNAAQSLETRARQFWQSVVVVWRLQPALLLLFARINNHVLTIAHKMKCWAEVKLSRILAPYFKNKYYSFTPLSCYDAKIPAAHNYLQRRASYGAKTVIMILDHGISLTHVCGLEFCNFDIH